MRDFATPHGRAAALTLPARILYTTFAALTLAGCVSCIVIYDRIVTFEARATPQQLYRRLTAHYLDADPAARARLVDTTHAHLFSMPVLLLIAGHLFLLAAVSPRVKVAAMLIACFATTLHLFTPWLIIAGAGNPLLTVLYPLSGGLLLVCFAVMLIVPVWQMWAPRGRQ